MAQNILILIGSPKAQNSTSNLISKNLEKKFTAAHLIYDKLYLHKCQQHEELLIDKLSTADTLILITPVYENNVPSTVLHFFELLSEYKTSFGKQNKQFFTIALAGYADSSAIQGTLNTCKLFANAMHFSWLGGIATYPATLIENEDLGKMYMGLITSLELLTKSLSQNTPLPKQLFDINTKSVLPAWLYRIAGSVIQKKVTKTIGKEAFYARPLI